MNYDYIHGICYWEGNKRFFLIEQIVFLKIILALYGLDQKEAFQILIQITRVFWELELVQTN